VLGDGNQKVSFSFAQDWVKVIPDVLNSSKSKNAVVRFIGETLTWNELINIIEEEVGKKLERPALPVTEIRAKLESASDLWSQIVLQLQYIMGSGLGEVESQDQTEFIPKFTTIREYVKQVLQKA
jgi:hypothetical protein